MNRILLTLLCSIVLGPAYGSEDSYLATSHLATWEFIQSVGGIRVGNPEKKASNSWVLPVICDVSGVTTVTQKPTTLNSPLVVTKILHQVVGNEIQISVVVNTPLRSSRDSRCTAIAVEAISAGEYKVLYQESNKVAHVLGTVTFL
jgi:hypothetical protein